MHGPNAPYPYPYPLPIYPYSYPTCDTPIPIPTLTLSPQTPAWTSNPDPIPADTCMDEHPRLVAADRRRDVLLIESRPV